MSNKKEIDRLREMAIRRLLDECGMNDATTPQPAGRVVAEWYRQHGSPVDMLYMIAELANRAALAEKVN